LNGLVKKEKIKEERLYKKSNKLVTGTSNTVERGIA
jgi:hypothetical protein